VNYIEAQRTADRCICGKCSGNLVVMNNKDGYYLRCVNNCDLRATGLRRLKSYTQIYLEGGMLPVHISNNIEKKLKKNDDKEA